MSFFNETLSARFCKGELKDIEKIVKLKRNDYENVSHFIRCAVINLVNAHKIKKKARL